MPKRRPKTGYTHVQLDLFAQPVEPAPPSPMKAAVATPPPPAGPAPDPAAPPARRPHLVRTTPTELAEKIAFTWYAHTASGSIAIPLGVTAALALLGHEHVKDRRDTATHVLGLDPAGLIKCLREIWAYAWLHDPYLVHCAAELARWLDEDPPSKVVTAVHAVARTAITSGLLSLTGDPDPAWRCEHDVLGALLTQLRSRGARNALAEFHTPPELANLIARMTMLEIPEPGGAFDDPAAGTGGLMRALALTLRLQGADPHQYVWSMADIDPIAAACCAVNAMVWSLGPNVLIYCGDTIATGDGAAQAAEQRRQILDNYERLMYGVAGIQAFIEADRLVDRLMSGVA